MGDRGKDMGDMRAIRAKMAAKYDNEVEATVRGWFRDLTGEDIGEGVFNVMRNLKSGQLLLKLMGEILNRTPNKPAGCNGIDIKAHTMNVEFKHMENISKFLHACEAYGVPRASLFQVPDLIESRNMAQVLSTIVMLGTETRRNNMDGPKIGPNPNQSNYRNFSTEKLQQGKGIITLQAGTNKCASQKGMVMGAVRHCSDMKITDLEREAYPEEVRKAAAARQAFGDQAPVQNEAPAVYENDQGGWQQEEEMQQEESFQAESAPAEEAESAPQDDGWAQQDEPQAEEAAYEEEADNTATFGGDEGDATATFGDEGDATATFGDEGEATATFGDEGEASATFGGEEEATVSGGVTGWTDEPAAEEDESSATFNLDM